METIMLVQKRRSYEVPYIPSSFAVIDNRVGIDQSRLSSGLRHQKTLAFSGFQIKPTPVPHKAVISVRKILLGIG